MKVIKRISHYPKYFAYLPRPLLINNFVLFLLIDHITKSVSEDKPKHTSLLYFQDQDWVLSFLCSFQATWPIKSVGPQYFTSLVSERTNLIILLILFQFWSLTWRERALRWRTCSCNLGNPETALKSLETGIEHSQIRTLAESGIVLCPLGKILSSHSASLFPGVNRKDTGRRNWQNT